MGGRIDKVRGNYSYIMNETGYYIVESSELVEASDTRVQRLKDLLPKL